jgi:hypothetical protein
MGPCIIIILKKYYKTQKRMERYQRLPCFRTLRETGREADRETDGEDR